MAIIKTFPAPASIPPPEPFRPAGAARPVKCSIVELRPERGKLVPITFRGSEEMESHLDRLSAIADVPKSTMINSLLRESVEKLLRLRTRFVIARGTERVWRRAA